MSIGKHNAGAGVRRARLYRGRSFRTGAFAVIAILGCAASGQGSMAEIQNFEMAPVEVLQSDELTKLQGALETRLQQGSRPTRAEIRTLVTEQGLPTADLEISAESTPTGLDVDAVDVALILNGTCVVAQIRNESIAVTELPILATGRCFVGSKQS